jgi:uncharacterized protein
VGLRVATSIPRLWSKDAGRGTAVYPAPVLDRYPTFSPSRLLRSAHLMTVLGSKLSRRLDQFAHSGEEFLLRVDRHTQVKIEAHWQADQQAPTMVLVHGLGGDARRSYMLGTAWKACQKGFSVLRMNMRNCGNTAHLSPTLYHAGLTDDIVALCDWLQSQRQSQAIFLAGFSLGGAQILNTLVRWRNNAPKSVRAVAVVSTPMDLHVSTRELHRGGLNRMYIYYFMHGFKKMWQEKSTAWPELFPVDGMKGIRNLHHFDDVWTAPKFGWANAAEYFEAASVATRLDQVFVPGLVIHAADDPFVPLTAAALDGLRNHRSLGLLYPCHGGHNSFLGARPARHGDWHDADSWWAENRIVQYATELCRPGC